MSWKVDYRRGSKQLKVLLRGLALLSPRSWLERSYQPVQASPLHHTQLRDN